MLALPMSTASPAARLVRECYLAVMEQREDDAITVADELLGTGFTDPEGWYLMGRNLVAAGAHERGFELVANAVRDGYTCPTRLERDRWLDPVRSRREFSALLAEAEARVRISPPAESAAVRTMYKKVGIDPTKTRPSSEALRCVAGSAISVRR